MVQVKNHSTHGGRANDPSKVSGQSIQGVSKLEQPSWAVDGAQRRTKHLFHSSKIAKQRLKRDEKEKTDRCYKEGFQVVWPMHN